MRKVELALIVSDPDQDCERIISSARACGLAPICCSNVAEARMLLAQEGFKLVFCKEVLSDGDFRAVLREAKRLDPYLPVILLSHSTDWDFYLKALGVGAFEVIVCPPNPLEAQNIILSALADTIDTEVERRAAA